MVPNRAGRAARAGTAALLRSPALPGLRIAMVTEFAYPVLGGVSEHVHHLSRELVALGHEVTVVTGRLPGRAPEESDRALHAADGYRTVRVGRSVPVVANKSVARVSVGARLRPRLAEILAGADVVHAQGLAAPILPLLALRASRAPVTVGTFHTYFTREGALAYRAFFTYVANTLARLDRKIAVSQPCVDAIGPLFPGPFTIIPNGIDAAAFRPAAPGEAPAGPPRLLFVGRLEPRNALGTLLDAAARLKADGRGFVLQVVGDGPLRTHYERSARRLGIWDRIEWLGMRLGERPRLYREATVFAAPCTLASFGVVLLEALASGTPVVCADNVGFRQVLRDGMPGRFTRPDDPADLAAALAELLDDPARRAEWAVLGRRLAEERYAWPGVACRVEELYLEVMREKGLLAPAPLSA